MSRITIRELASEQQGDAVRVLACAFDWMVPAMVRAIAGGALAVPFLWYASGAPRGSFFSPAIFITLAAAAWLIRQGRRRLAAVCAAPFVMVVAMLALAVVSQW